MLSAADSTLIAAGELAALVAGAVCTVIDCRFDLSAPRAGHAAWLEAHVPGAAYADLERDLSGPPATDRGRHPLPPVARMQRVFGALGIDAERPVVVYDDAGGMYAARLWWMLRYLGHSARVLDGGWQAWVNGGHAVKSGIERVQPRRFDGAPRRDRLVTVEAITRDMRLLDARAPARYRGEHEPLDRHPGHIPGARNHFWQANLGPDGRFLAAPTLARQLGASLGILPDAATVHYCGSGVSACHNVLAQVAAGLPEPRLYCGSWSEWCGDGERPRALGGETA